jgi:dTDP-glucose 4,6-dehydratase
MTEGRQIVVIGSNSFSGASFVRHLLAGGNEVVGISRSVEPDDVFLPYRWFDHAGRFDFYALDLNSELNGIMGVLDRVQPAYVVNFAAQSMVAQSWDNPAHWFQTNVVATIRLHDELRTRDYLTRYVHITTPEVYGSTSGGIREDAPFNPSTPYAVSRAATDMSLRTYSEAYGFPVVSTRAANVFGPGQQLYRIIPRTVLAVLAGRTLELHGGGVSKRSFIHIDDVSAATELIARQGSNGECYHISTNRMVSIRELVELICEKLGADVEQHVRVVPERVGKDVAYELDSRKLRAELGWEPVVTLEAGIEATIDWARDNLDNLSRQPMDYAHRP